MQKYPDKTAIIFEPNDPCEKNKLFTYSELLKEVCKMANVLKSMGVKKEIESVFIYP